MDLETLDDLSEQYAASLRQVGGLSASERQIGGSYYKDMPVQPWDVVDGWSVEEQIAVYRHGALKYLMRMGTKDERIQEIEKAKHYIEKLLEVLYEANLPSNPV